MLFETRSLYWKHEHAKVERWGKEGSEPTTAFERAFRGFVQGLKTFDEVNGHWDKTHKAFAATIVRRDAYVNNLSREVWLRLRDDQKQTLVDALTKLYQDINTIDTEIDALDNDPIDAAIPWGIKLEKLEAAVREAKSQFDRFRALKALKDHVIAFGPTHKQVTSRMSDIQRNILRIELRIRPAQVMVPPNLDRPEPD